MAVAAETRTGLEANGDLDLFDLDVQVTVKADDVEPIHLSAETHLTACTCIAGWC